MSAISFSFRPEAIPVYAQTEFLNRFFQLVLDYQYLTTPTPPSPSAQDLPMPSKFQNMEGDEPAPMKKVRKNPWADLTEEQRAERLAAMKLGRQRKAAERRQSADSLDAPAPTPSPVLADELPVARSLNNGGINLGSFDGPTAAPAYEDWTNQQLRDELADRDGIPRTPEGQKPSGVRRNTPSFPYKAALVAELRRRDALPKTEHAPAPASVTDAASETSSKKLRKNPWADLTPEQHAERIAKMRAGKAAKAAAALTAAADGSA
jgi:hypothetical protein